MTRAYYNEWDKFAAQWLRNLIAAGHLPEGEVDERSIADVVPGDLAGFGQCHFFAGIGGWPLALKLAGWPEDAEVWTGSCPCQPLSGAGQRRGHADERHLWPAFQCLIAERKPATVFGEQIASKDGREWLAGVRADLEALGYAVGAADLCAASVGAPHIRQRLWWVADAERRASERSGYELAEASRGVQVASRQQRVRLDVGNGRDLGAAANAEGGGRRLPVQPRRPQQEGVEPERRGEAGELGDADDARSQGRRQRSVERADQRAPWAASEFIHCTDGKARRAQPSIFPLAHGVSGRMGKLRAAGNAIVPQVAAEFVSAFMEARP